MWSAALLRRFFVLTLRAKRQPSAKPSLRASAPSAPLRYPFPSPSAITDHRL